MKNNNNTANVEGEWFINENLDLAYLSTLAFDSILSDTSTDADSCPWSAIDVLTSLYALVRSSLMLHEKTSGAKGAFFEVPAKHKGQKPILFGKFEFEPITVKVQKTMMNFHSSSLQAKRTLYDGEHVIQPYQKV